MRLTTQAFDRIVKRAINCIPGEIRQHLDNVVIAVRKHPNRRILDQLGLPPGEEPLGYYEGTSLMERSFFSPVDYPGTIFIFQRPLEEMCQTAEELEEEIRITVVHEIAHLIGLDEERLGELGYE